MTSLSTAFEASLLLIAGDAGSINVDALVGESLGPLGVGLGELGGFRSS